MLHTTRLHPKSTLFPYTTLFRSPAYAQRCPMPPVPEGQTILDVIAQKIRDHHATLGTDLSRFTSERSEEHTSELQSHHDLVCRLLLEKKKNTYYYQITFIRPHC